MKILVTTGLYPPEIGGPATYTKIIETYLPKYGYEVSVLPFSSVRHLPKIIRHIAFFFKCLLLARGADIIFAQDPVSVGLPTMLAAKLLSKDFFLRLGGDYAWEQGRLRFGITAPLDEFACCKGRLPAMMCVFKWIQTSVASAARRVTVQSEFMKKIVMCWGIPEQKITVIPNGFSTEGSAGDKEVSRQVLNVHGTIAVSAGRLVPWKGMGGLIEIVPEIVQRIPDFRLYIIGDGPEKDELQDMAIECGLIRQVIFTGRLDKETLAHYLSAADVFILNTEYEGFSNQLLEVYAAGTPIVTTAVGGNPEMVSDGTSGLLVPVGNNKALAESVLKVLEDNALARRLVNGGKEKLRAFSVERVIIATDAFLS